MKLSLQRRWARGIAWCLLLLVNNLVADPVALLYDANIPQNAGLVRVFNPEAGTLQVKMNGLTGSSEMDPWSMVAHSYSAYLALPPGRYQLECGLNTQPLRLQASAIKTIVCDQEHRREITAQVVLNDRKALLQLQNMTPAQLSLTTIDGEIRIIESVGSWQQGNRYINETRLPLAVTAKGKILFQFPAYYFQRGRSYTLWVGQFDGQLSGGVTADQIQNTTP